MLLTGNSHPPIISGSAERFPLLGNDLIERILHQAGEVGGRGQL